MPRSETQKHREFVEEPIGDKDVYELAGICQSHGDRLVENGYDKAYCVLGQYLACGKSPSIFKKWLRDITDANAYHQNLCYKCLKEWCENGNSMY